MEHPVIIERLVIFHDFSVLENGFVIGNIFKRVARVGVDNDGLKKTLRFERDFEFQKFPFCRAWALFYFFF